MRRLRPMKLNFWLEIKIRIWQSGRETGSKTHGSATALRTNCDLIKTLCNLFAKEVARLLCECHNVFLVSQLNLNLFAITYMPHFTRPYIKLCENGLRHFLELTMTQQLLVSPCHLGQGRDNIHGPWTRQGYWKRVDAPVPHVIQNKRSRLPCLMRMARESFSASLPFPAHGKNIRKKTTAANGDRRDSLLVSVKSM